MMIFLGTLTLLGAIILMTDNESLITICSVTFVATIILSMTSFCFGEERTLNLNEWLSQTHCTNLISTCMEGKEKLYIVDDCKPGDRISRFEIEELTKALDIMFPAEVRNEAKH